MSEQSNPVLEIFLSLKGKEIEMSPSPLTAWLRPIMEEAEAGSLTFSYLVRKEMTNPAGTLHGGVIAAIMDDIMGATMYTLDPNSFKVSINLNVDFFYTAKEGERVMARTSIAKNGSKVVNAQCDLFNEEGRLLAKGYSNLLSKA